MSPRLLLSPSLLLSLCCLAPAAVAAPVSIFDGRTLTGWEGDPKWWRVQDGCLTGGSTTEKVPRNFFLATTKSYQNFDLRLKLKLTGVPNTGMINSGVQIRSLRIPNNTEMAGYQVDAGDGWWGKLYDESRRRKVIAEPGDAAAVNAAVKKGDWNEYRILAEGPRLRSWINGVPALDYTEAEPNIARDGSIAVQIHSGGIALVQVKDVTVEELPPTPGAPTWAKVGLPPPPPPKAKAAPKKTASTSSAAPSAPPAPAATATKTGRDISYNAISQGALSPAEQRASFKVPAGFEIELVAAESEGAGKFISVAWDARMRLWTMTAFEYPVDANENQAASDALFARGGRDRVLVFDHPYTSAPGPPRVFADGLVMPLGIQPYRDGAFVQYGPDIRFYRDTNGDGRADRHETLLTGFGTQDSHLFPHQFLRQPGGWMMVAQGLFNYSKVRRPDGRPFADGTAEVPFNQCKLARFTLDGTQFETLTAGPNNIWGLVTSRTGETFLQEANDQGYPVIPYAPGIHVRTGSRDLLRPYQPLMPPPLAPAQMGGTGLSGLALAEDRDGLFRSPAGAAPAGAQVFYLANPITGTVQLVQATPDGPRYRYEKLPDFLTTTDRWFRPVAIHFGPDGALYIVDWYNKIISHNEVPRTHPDRDKARGRIWRVRHRDQPRTTPPDLTRLSERDLLAQLGGPNALVSRLAWLELTDRRATALTPDLAALAADRAAPAERRLAALWALEGLQPVAQSLLVALAADPHPALRREAARLAATTPRPEAEFVALATPLLADPRPDVRAVVGDALRRVPASPRIMHLAAQLGRASLDPSAHAWDRYDREFERYLARWALERNPAATTALLASPEGRALPLENRVLATLALGGRDAALGLARLAGELSRPFVEEEIRTLAAHFPEPAVRDVLGVTLASPSTRPAVLRALLTLRTSIDPRALARPLTTAAQALLASPAEADVTLGVEVAGAFQLADLTADLVALLRRAPASAAVQLAALRALRELAAGPADLFESLLRSGATPALRDEALNSLAATRDPAAPTRLVQLLPTLSTAQRGRGLDQLARSPAGATALAAGLQSGQLAVADLGLNTLDRLRTLLPNDATIAALWQKHGADGLRVLQFGGAHGDYSATQLTLEGPFTVECWVKLAAPISNVDGLLGAPGQFSLNFHASQLRLWLGGGLNDVVVAKKKIAPGAWTHTALSRDAEGTFRLYLNGELDATGTKASTAAFSRLDLGRASPTTGGTAGAIAEFRVWREARTAAALRANFDRTFAGDPSRPPTLAHLYAGNDWGPLHGQAKIEFADDAPTLLTAAEASAQAERFQKFRVLANARGNPEHGKELFTAICLACHQQGGKGGQLAPALDGAGLTGVDALLRNLLTPSAAMEGAYRIYRVVTNDGRVLEGFLVDDQPEFVVLRLPGAEDRRLPRAEIRQAAYLRRSLMPEGLLDALPPEHVSNLFAHLKSLK